MGSLLCFATGRLSLDLFDTSLLTCEGTEIVKLSTTNATELINSDAVDSGRVRRAKLYYLRALTGKKARIKEIKA